MHPSEKVTKQLTVRGGVNPYGQPDRKISVFFDDFPYVIIAKEVEIFQKVKRSDDL